MFFSDLFLDIHRIFLSLAVDTHVVVSGHDEGALFLVLQLQHSCTKALSFDCLFLIQAFGYMSCGARRVDVLK
jgi:hypothetical protein